PAGDRRARRPPPGCGSAPARSAPRAGPSAPPSPATRGRAGWRAARRPVPLRAGLRAPASSPPRPPLPAGAPQDLAVLERPGRLGGALARAEDELLVPHAHRPDVRVPREQLAGQPLDERPVAAIGAAVAGVPRAAQ